MIANHQPTIFPPNVIVGLSSVDDGSMKDGIELQTKSAVTNRSVFLQNLAMPVAQAATFYASFEGDEYCRYVSATPGLLSALDGVSTTQSMQPIMVPLADCTGAVLYDPVRHVLMVSHLGRHSTEQFGARKSVEYMVSKYGSVPTELLIWLSQSPSKESYPLFAFEGKGFKEVLCEQFRSAGVLTGNIEVSAVDTASDKAYFSHSEFLKGRRTSDGRYAIAAMMQ